MGGLGGSMLVMGEGSVSQWILGVMRFQKIFGLYGVERHKGIPNSQSFIASPD